MRQRPEAARSTQRRRLLGQPVFRRLFLAQSISFVGDGMVNVAIAFAILETGGDASDIGVVFAARMLCLVASLLGGGVLADRLPRGGLMVAADLVRVCSQGAFAALVIAGDPSVWALAVLAGLTGTATGVFNPASTGIVPTLVAAEDLQQASALRGLAQAAGQVTGPVLAGALVVGVGAGWAIAADALTFAVSAALLVSLPRAPRDPRPRKTFVRDLIDGWDAFRSRRWIWSFVLAASVGNLLFASWRVLGPVVADERLGGATAWGVIVAALGAGSVAGGLLAFRARPARPMLVATLGVSVFALPLALLAAAAPAPAVATGAFVTGVGLMLSNAVWESTLQRHVPPETLSRVSAYDWFGSVAFEPLGFAAWGFVAAAVGVSTSLWVAFLLQVMSVLILLAVPEIRTLRPYPAGMTPEVAGAVTANRAPP